MKKRISLLLLLVLALSACGIARFGRDFDPKVFESQVERGKSTQSQVRGWLGAPVGSGIVVDASGERFEEWTYYYGETRLPNGADAFLKVLQVRFDRGGVVRSYNWSGQAK
jgi:outer membrane protein assembly factor BamE (lipoprotein component of BamABCDE complex)